MKRLPLDLTPFQAGAHGIFDPERGIEQCATGFEFTEGPLWDPRNASLLFSDIPANRIYRWKEAEPAAVVREPSGKSNGLAWDAGGRLLACEHLNRRLSVASLGADPVTLVDSYRGARLNSPNDLVVHARGDIFFTDPPYGIQSAAFGAPADQELPFNGLFRLDPVGGEPVLLASDFDRPNGLAFSPCLGWLYVADTPRYHLRRFAIADDLSLGGGELLAEFDAEFGEGRPDGMTVDSEGRIFTTGPGGIWVLSAQGDHLLHVRFPEKTANCCWGDADGRSLYVTASTSLYRLRLAR